MDDRHEEPIDVGPEKQPPPPQKPAVEMDADVRQWGMFAHLSGLVAIWVTGGIGGWAGPLIVWLMKKDEMPFVEDQAKEALNFQITIAIAMLVTGGLTALVCVTFPLLMIIPIVQIVFSIIGGMAANKGETYRYPMTIRMIT